MSIHLYNHGYPHPETLSGQKNPCSEIRNTDIQADIRADIGATDIGARFKTDIRCCTDISTRTSLILRISKRISARPVRPGVVLAVSKNVLTAPIFSNSRNFEMEGDTPEKHGIKSLDP